MENSYRLNDDYLLPYNARNQNIAIHVREHIESVYDSKDIIAIEMRLRELSMLYSKKVVVHLTCNDNTFNMIKLLWTNNTNLQIEREEVKHE